jgi:hypothetical protein
VDSSPFVNVGALVEAKFALLLDRQREFSVCRRVVKSANTKPGTFGRLNNRNHWKIPFVLKLGECFHHSCPVGVEFLPRQIPIPCERGITHCSRAEPAKVGKHVNAVFDLRGLSSAMLLSKLHFKNPCHRDR